nr:MAG TPA: hypothetical protein [Caudoviricetes sp.]
MAGFFVPFFPSRQQSQIKNTTRVDKQTHFEFNYKHRNVIEAGSPRSSCRRHTKHRMR